MAIVYLEDGRLADQFVIGKEPYVLSDALVMHPDDYAMLMPADIELMKQQRYDNWYAIVTAAANEPPIEEAPADPAV